MTSISRRDLLKTGALAAAAIPSVNFVAPAAPRPKRPTTGWD